MGEAILRGLFGVEVSLDGVTLQPRLGSREGSVRVYQPSTDRYAAICVPRRADDDRDGLWHECRGRAYR